MCKKNTQIRPHVPHKTKKAHQVKKPVGPTHVRREDGFTLTKKPDPDIILNNYTASAGSGGGLRKRKGG